MSHAVLAAGLDPAVLRRDFPILDQTVNGHPLVYLDNAATSQKPTAVLEALEQYYRHDNANVHRGIHELSRRATAAYEDARVRIGRFVGAHDPAEVIFTRGTTEGINLIASSWGLEHLRPGDEIVLTGMEHHSNIVPWQLVARRTGAVLRWIELDDEGKLQLEALSSLIGPRTRVVSLVHVSNALGTVNPVAEIVARVRDRAPAAVIVVDGAQAVPHLPVDVPALGCDAYAFSGHKMCGPTGIGVLWARRALLDSMPPFMGGGEMIRIVERDASTWADLPHKFEAGTPDIAGAVGLGAAVDYLSALGMANIARHERELLTYALDRLATVPGFQALGPTRVEDRSGVISFTLGDAHPHDVATILDSQGVAIRAGHHCAQLVMKRYCVAATTRASFYFYNTTDEVDRLVEGLHVVRGIFGWTDTPGRGASAPHPPLESLYQQLILDHYRRPRNRGELPDKTVEVHMANPVCGDEIRLQMKVEDDVIRAVRFVGQGCSISQASISMMTNLLEGRRLEEADVLAGKFTRMMHGDESVASDRALGDLRALKGVSKFPVRIKCALLGFDALQEALKRSGHEPSAPLTHEPPGGKP